jgi:hypothetical protein
MTSLVDSFSVLMQNFLVSIFEGQYGRSMTLGDGSRTDLGQMTDNLNLAFSIVFIFELMINLLAHWLRAFIHNAWVSVRLPSCPCVQVDTMPADNDFTI